MCTRSQDKVGSPWESGSDLAVVLGGPPRKAVVNVACCGEKEIGNKALGNIRQLPFSGGGHFGKNVAPLVSQLLRSPRANNNLGEITALPLRKQAT